ncbi:hypothetical protein A9Q84_10625 [Halobacteriovorax marinus]|uniref:Uncharacterized protein n=1 Tax=Halobacteriovorax marinus TaxID=97084 RepID=A0A1Y5F7A5_9BACT|nr:hypothetical protein A9Q84_10625 [Halobacteriovorax marinus]
MKKIIIVLLILANNVHAAGVRNNLKRYTYLRDKTIVNKRLHSKLYENYFDIDLNLSSGTKSIVGDIKNSSNSSSSTADKEAAILSILNKNMNSERYIDLEISTAVPLPTFSLFKYRLTPSLFYSINMGALVTISNQASVIDPSAGVYVKKDTKMGVSTIITKHPDKETQVKVNLYQLKRADVDNTLNKTQIVTDTKLFDFGALDKGETSIALDFIWKRSNSKRSWSLEMLEAKIIPMSTITDVKYDHFPLFHAYHQWHKKPETFWLEPFVGVHMRKRYSLFDGLYVGTWLQLKELPFRSSLNISTQFITFIPEFKGESFYFNYKLRLAYINPQEDIWVPAIHSFNLGFTF